MLLDESFGCDVAVDPDQCPHVAQQGSLVGRKDGIFDTRDARVERFGCNGAQVGQHVLPGRSGLGVELHFFFDGLEEEPSDFLRPFIAIEQMSSC